MEVLTPDGDEVISSLKDVENEWIRNEGKVCINVTLDDMKLYMDLGIDVEKVHLIIQHLINENLYVASQLYGNLRNISNVDVAKAIISSGNLLDHENEIRMKKQKESSEEMMERKKRVMRGEEAEKKAKEEEEKR